ncbi:hypothetical protein BJ138DRAFT_346700 [Hygrophoropsis aurantiaca]|uniref:Uncharacterized protein n=1 Tax=Hygrophoropsis aurantiaca TaxID=72124 RepID=A0ACB8ANS6_9AGAM|nr:hypothetical protein BJ138DRAFT_346700 [Hygrophoropsis aurantiaca]
MVSSTSEAALKLEIARLTGAINRHKSTQYPAEQPKTNGRSNTYVNPNYKPPTSTTVKTQAPFKFTQRYIRPSSASSSLAAPGPSRDVVIGGVTFESSGRSLVRKDLPRPATSIAQSSRPVTQQVDYSRTAGGHLLPSGRAYKSKVSSRGRRGRVMNRNMTLDNTRSSYQSVSSLDQITVCNLIDLCRRRRPTSKRMKYLDKPCPRFTTTGACSRGLTCLYQHDPNKIAICWNFLQGNCPNNAETCNLSHDPTPERTPLCVHFANNGRCTRDKCPYPHVRVGQRTGVCRDFAVLGYCGKGLDCEMQHVRECPDFAEKGICSTKGCKLPHVIRANRNRKPAVQDTPSAPTAVASAASTDNELTSGSAPVKDGQLGDEYISLMFNESEESEDDDEEEEENDDSVSDEEEGEDPTQEDESDAVPVN